MRRPPKRNAARAGERGGVSRALTSEGQLRGIYPAFGFNANEFATAIVAERHRLPRHVARVVCELAKLGGRS